MVFVSEKKNSIRPLSLRVYRRPAILVRAVGTPVFPILQWVESFELIWQWQCLHFCLIPAERNVCFMHGGKHRLASPAMAKPLITWLMIAIIKKGLNWRNNGAFVVYCVLFSQLCLLLSYRLVGVLSPVDHSGFYQGRQVCRLVGWDPVCPKDRAWFGFKKCENRQVD